MRVENKGYSHLVGEGEHCILVSHNKHYFLTSNSNIIALRYFLQHSVSPSALAHLPFPSPPPFNLIADKRRYYVNDLQTPTPQLWRGEGGEGKDNNQFVDARKQKENFYLTITTFLCRKTFDLHLYIRY